jgi:uroporphyrinogen-III synthase
MRILLTRAPEDAARTAEKLKAQGHQILSSPVFEIQPRDAEWPKGVIDAVVATSAQAFEQAQFAPDRPLPETRRLLRLFAVGEKTAEAAKRCGFTGEQIVAPDAKALADVIVTKVPAAARLAYLAGADRKSDLETRCKEARVEIIPVELYEARAAEALNNDALSAFKAGEIDAIMHYSRRSAEIFLKLAESAGIDAKAIRHVAISADAAAPLQAAGCAQIAVAVEPKEQAMLALLPRQTATANGKAPAPTSAMNAEAPDKTRES